MSPIIINTHLNPALLNLCFSAGVKYPAKCKQYWCLHAWENDKTIEKALSKSGGKTQVVKKSFVGGRFVFYFQFKELLSYDGDGI